MSSDITAILRSNGSVCLLGELEREYKRKNWSLGAKAIALTDFAVAYIKRDGTVDTQWYQDYYDDFYDYDTETYEEVYHTDDWRNVSVLRAGSDHIVGLTDSGRVYATGNNEDGQCNVSGWSKIVDIAAFNNTTIGLRSDGTVVMTGENESDCSEAKMWKNVSRIFAGNCAVVGIKNDGSVVTTNDDWKDELADWRDIVNVALSTDTVIGVKKSGYVKVACDYYNDKKTEFKRNVEGWSDIVDAAIVWDLEQFAIGLRSNGKLVSASTEGDRLFFADKRIDVLGVDNVMIP